MFPLCFPQGFNLLSEYFEPYKGRSYTRFFTEPLRVTQGKAKLHRGKAAITHPRGKVKTTPKTTKGPEYGGEAWDVLVSKGTVQAVEVPHVIKVANGKVASVGINGKTAGAQAVQNGTKANLVH